MGGNGSGRYKTGNKRDTVEDAITINLFKLYREGFITPGGRGRGLMSAGPRHTMNYTLDNNTLTLSYTLKHGSDAGRQINETIRLSYTCPYYGGIRLWMHCPACDRRVGKLYFPPGGTRYLCRECGNLTYTSCQESTHNELINAFKRLTKLCKEERKAVYGRSRRRNR